VLRFIIGILLFTTLLLSSSSVSFGTKTKVYTVRLFSVAKSVSEKTILSKIPTSLKDSLYLVKVQNGTVAYYSQSSNYKSAREILKKIKKGGYKKAYITRASKEYLQVEKKVDTKKTTEEKTEEKTEKTTKETTKDETKKTEETTEKITQRMTPKLSKYVISQMIAKANRAYKNANEEKVMIYYEMLLSSGVKSEKIKNNLCYLYGKNGAWPQAKNIIDKETYPAKLIYAYANGAVQTSQESFYNDMRQYIMIDRSGHLALLAGYYFEQNGNRKKAFEFYKIAYEKNRNDVYNIYAYARYLDIIGKNSDAIKLYSHIYKRTKKNTPLHKALGSILHR